MADTLSPSGSSPAIGAAPRGEDGKPRCGWAYGAPEFIDYHDREWGFPIADDRHLFEKICLEGFQSGLSWRTILNKRPRFRAVFDNFDFHKMARYDDGDLARLLADPGIIRHRGKIEAVINNARRACEMVQDEGSLAAFFWRYEARDDDGVAHIPQSITTSVQSHALSRELKKRGWKFVGPTTMFAFMQSMGMINDHLHDCVTCAEVRHARQNFQSPARHGE